MNGDTTTEAALRRLRRAGAAYRCELLAEPITVGPECFAGWPVDAAQILALPVGATHRTAGPSGDLLQITRTA